MKLSVRQLTMAGVLCAITMTLGLIPQAGFIEIPGIAVTTMHIPTILAGVLQGPLVGGIVGGFFGFFSWLKAIGPAVNPLDRLIFSNPLIAFIPRILVGIVSHYVFIAGNKEHSERPLSLAVGLVMGYTGFSLSVGFGYWVRLLVTAVFALFSGALIWVVVKNYGHSPALAAIAGSLTNTVLVLGASALFGYLPIQIVLTVAVTNGIPEAAVAMVLTTAIYRLTRGLFVGR